MKKIIALVSALTLLASFTSCNKESDPTFVGDWTVTKATQTVKGVTKEVEEVKGSNITFSYDGKVMLWSKQVGTYTLSENAINITDTQGDAPVTVKMNVDKLTSSEFTISGTTKIEDEDVTYSVSAIRR